MKILEFRFGPRLCVQNERDGCPRKVAEHVGALICLQYRVDVEEERGLD